MAAHKIIRLSKSCIGKHEKQAVMGVLDREMLGMGAEVQDFEEALGDFFGRQAICVVNGTAGIHLAVQACGIAQGDEVLVPSLTYVASFQAISATGAIPIPCDIDPDTWAIDWRDAERRLTSRTKCVMPVHYGGGVGDLDAIYGFAHEHRLRIIEDSAHAFGSVHKGRRIGSFGDVSCFSFDGIKNITSGEGGCVVSADEEVLGRIRDARLLGVQRDTERRYSGQRSWSFDVSKQGWRYHMSNVMAAIGIEQLKRFPKMAKKRQQLARQYDSLLGGHPRLLPIRRNYDDVVPHIYVVRIRGLEDRQWLQDSLLERGVQTGFHYQPNHWLTLYVPGQVITLPVTDSVFPELLTLPLHPDLSSADVVYTCEQLVDLLQRHEGSPLKFAVAPPINVALCDLRK